MNTCKPKCAVSACPRDACRESLCAVHALNWLLSRDSAPTPGRDNRLRQFVARQDVRGVLRKATSPAGYVPPDTRRECRRCNQPALESGICAGHTAEEVGI